ncbi:ABC transporter substrate-binding protein [Streptomyces indicus]|uniref:Peptide/nickel transport system substrate-binding protein n=1 Tax=Streptomyces indicus TaxID=417292 RepID=A0A1G8YHC5_9ACTN|nr:ABC transporter substrate-binding protein [Streptomyces indicus]SDK02067.1 peptide/nickel transport system substrate-binding protein [Streptomyces indicus]
MARSVKTTGAVRAAALAAALGLAATACTTSDGTSTGGGGKGGGGGSATLQLTGDPTTLDPAKGTAVQDLVMSRMLYDVLVRRDDGGEIVGNLAKSWEQPSAKEATFTLNEGITCTDGTKLTATDIAASLKRLADPKTGGYPAFGAGNTATITADDKAGTVNVKLAKPYSDLLYGMSSPQAGIICPKALKDESLLKSGGKGAGTGRWWLDKSTAGSAYTLAGRDGYTWGAKYKKAPAGDAPKTVVMKILPNESTMANELLSGSLDYAGITGPDAARLAKAPDKVTMVPTPLIRMMVVFNQKEGHPGADKKFRDAVGAAIDRKAFNDTVTKGTGEVIASLADKSVPCASTDESWLAKPDKAAAAKALKGVKVKVVGTNAVASGAGNEFVQAVLKAAGAEVELRNVDNTTWATEVPGGKGDWDITVLPNVNTTNLLTHPASLLVGEAPPAGRNFGSVNNPDFAAGFGEAMANVDEAKKCAAWEKAQKAALTNRDVLPLTAIKAYYTSGKKVEIASPDGILDTSTVRLKK